MTAGDLRAYALMARLIGAGLWLLAGALAGVIALLAWQARQPETLPGIVTVATPAKVLTRVERVTVPCTVVQAYAPAAKRRIKLPPTVRDNPDTHVLASSDVRSSERDTRISTVLDTSTGAVDTYTEALPLPWLRPEARGELGLSYGFKAGNPAPVVRLDGRVDLLQTKTLHWGLAGEAFSDGDWFAGMRVSGRF